MFDGLKQLFNPGHIGGLTINNRIVMPPMATGFASEDGYVSDRLIDYYSQRATGGAGLVIVEVASVDRLSGKGIRNQICIDDDRYLEGLERLSDSIKNSGAKTAIQLHHAGAQSPASLINTQPVGPSSIERRGVGIPRELSTGEIRAIIKSYIDAAERAKKAGFDAVEIHGAHGYLPAQFLSPVWNVRDDEYGGNLEKRVRFPIEIIIGIKDRLGNYPLIFRFNAVELGAEFFQRDIRGQTLEEGRHIAGLLEKAGADALHVSCFGYGIHALHNMPDFPGALLPYAEAIKQKVNIPVIAVGFLTANLAEDALKHGKADFVSMGRAHITDPELVFKMRQGKLSDIKPCIGCIHCLEVLDPSNTKGYRCSVNALAGREKTYNLEHSGTPKRVLVIGGGPAGMEAAHNACLKGHVVHLVESSAKLGGQLRYAEKAPGKSRISIFKEFLINRLMNSTVKLSLNTQGTPALIHAEKPDKVIIATGAIPVIPPIAGIDLAKNTVSALKVFDGTATVGNSVVIIGGELVGCEAADLISEAGWRKVTILRRGKYLATRLNPLVRHILLARLKQKGVTLRTQINYKEITENGIIIIDQYGSEHTVEADTIILAAGSRPDRQLFEAVINEFDVKIIGDSSEPRDIREAIREGLEAGIID